MRAAGKWYQFAGLSGGAKSAFKLIVNEGRDGTDGAVEGRQNLSNGQNLDQDFFMSGLSRTRTARPL